MARIAPIKTAALATANYGTNGGSTVAQTNWATNFNLDIPAILSAAQAAIPFWQSQVALPQSGINMNNGLNRAKANVSAIQTKVNTVGKASYTAGVKAAAAPGGNYAAFSAAWQPAVGNEVASLNVTDPRGDKAANTARMLAYNTWVNLQAGKFRVK